MKKWSSRWFLMSVYGITASIVLSWEFGEPSAFIAVTTIALGGGHLTNVMERRNSRPEED